MRTRPSPRCTATRSWPGLKPPSSSTAAVIETGTSRSVRNAKDDGSSAIAAGRNDVNRTLMLVPARGVRSAAAVTDVCSPLNESSPWREP